MRALRRGLLRTRGFGLFVAVCDNLQLEADLIEILADSLPGAPPQVVRLGPESEDPLDEVGKQAGTPPSGPVMVVGLAAVLGTGEGGTRLLGALNLRRPEWPARVAQPIVFWVPARFLGALLRGAPDFFDWRTDTVSFLVAPRPMLDPLRHGDRPFPEIRA